ncbi:hypothetical protein LCGC14_2198340, partial [marine sediment metagenome]
QKLINTNSFYLLRDAKGFTDGLRGHWRLTSQEFEKWTPGTNEKEISQSL